MPEQNPEITQDDVDRVLRQARAFYKPGLKSSNKMYRGGVDNDDKIVMDEKEARRNDNAPLAGNDLAILDDKTANMSPLEKGEYLVTHQIKYGNCGEMTRATLHLCTTDAVLRAKMTGAWVADSIPHIFLLVSDGPRVDAPNRLNSLTDLANPAYDRVWVIDTWMNIACKGADYKNHIDSKIAQWHQQDKVITQERDLETVKITSSHGEEKTREILMPDEDQLETAPAFAKRLLGAQVNLEQITLPRLENTQHPSNSPPPLKRQRIQATGEGSSSGATSVHPPQRSDHVSNQATQSPSETPKQSTLKRGFGRP